jgi:hypothetical protein
LPLFCSWQSVSISAGIKGEKPTAVATVWRSIHAVQIILKPAVPVRTWNIKLNKDYTLLSLILKKVHVTEHPEAVSLYGAGAELP